MTTQWKWFGSPGHFICAKWCRFHLCTQVGKFLVSTIGEYVHPRHGKGSEKDEQKWLELNWPGEDIGYGRKYETMVFRTGKPCTLPGCMCGQPVIDGVELDSRGCNTRQEANANHIELCEKWDKENERISSTNT